MSLVENPIDFVSIDQSALPEEEREPARSIEHNLSSLASLTDTFRYHVDLYLDSFQRKQGVDWENEAERMKLITWMRGAARLGALDAYSFSMVMQAINKTKAPTIWARANMKARREATKLFASEFPLISAIRQPAAHLGELSKNPAEQNRHQLLSFGLFLGRGVNAEPDRATYTATYEGKMAGYELSDAKADVLATVAQLYRETFYPLEHPRHAMHRATRLGFELRRAKD